LKKFVYYEINDKENFDCGKTILGIFGVIGKEFSLYLLLNPISFRGSECRNKLSNEWIINFYDVAPYLK